MDHPAFDKPRRVRIKSHVPGRVRLRLQPQSRNRATMESIQQKLQTLQGINGVRLNPANGSVTVNYDHAHHSMAGILGLLEDLDVVVDSIGHLPGIGEPAHGNGSPMPEFLAAIEDLDQRIQRITGFSVNLKRVLPLSFVGAGLWSIGRRGLMIERVPGWLFLWFAFDMFVKLHPARSHPASPPDNDRQ